MFSKIYILYILFTYKSFYTMLDKDMRKNIKKKKKRRDEEIGKHELSEMGALSMRWKK